jgi:hypothetical protein
VAVKIELSRQAKAMLDEADERWMSEHGFDADNPLLDEVARAAELLRENPELGVLYRRHAFRRDPFCSHLRRRGAHRLRTSSANVVCERIASLCHP